MNITSLNETFIYIFLFCYSFNIWGKGLWSWLFTLCEGQKKSYKIYQSISLNKNKLY